MNLLEKMVVNEEFLKRKDVYNLTEGGTGSWTYVNSDDVLSFNRRSEIQKHRFEDPEQRKNTSEKTKEGLRNMTEEQVFEMRRKITQKLVDYYKTRTPTFKGKKHTKETRKKMSEIQKLNPRIGSKNGMFDTSWVSSRELNVTFQIPNSMLYDYIAQGYIKGVVHNWQQHDCIQILQENHISIAHLSPEEKELYKKYDAKGIIQLRQKKNDKKELKLKERIKEVQEMADYYSIYGFEKTKEKFKGKPGLTSLENLVQTIFHYKKHYGIHFEPIKNHQDRFKGRGK